MRLLTHFNKLGGGVILPLLLLLISNLCYAEKVIDWQAGETITNKTYNGETDGTLDYRIRIHGDINMKGYIQIGNSTNSINCIVEIDESVQRSVTLKNIGSADSFFRVDENSSLTIRGRSNEQRIILDGGSNEGKEVKWEIIGTAGTLNLEYVTIQNHKNNFEGRWAPAIKINPWEGRTLLGKTTIKNCKFTNLNCDCSPVIFVDGRAVDAKVTSEDCAVKIEDTEICYCTVRKGDGRGATDAGKYWGGVIRTRGGTTSNLYLTRVKIHDNIADSCSCAGVLWNAMGDRQGGKRQPTLILNGCEFYGNKALYSGGALRIETNCRFEGAQTKIYNNEAGVMGGGIHIYGYAGGYFNSQEFNYELNDKLYVHGNKAQYGAGIGIQLNDACTLKKGTNFNVHYNGAVIKNNMAKVKGGGIYYENIARPDSMYVINLHLNKGEISGNSVAPDPTNPKFSDKDIVATSFYDELNGAGSDKFKSSGGGIFLYNANIKYDSSNPGQMTMNDNKASVYGGAVFVNGKLASLNLQSLSASSNKAMHGAAVACISIAEPSSQTPITDYGSKITVDNASFENNNAGENGGAIYVERGIVELKNDAKFFGNKSKSGGAIYTIQKSTLTIGQVTFENNIAHENGGAIYVQSGGKINITSGAVFRGNQMTRTNNGGGGAICVKNDWTVKDNGDFITANIKNAIFENNYSGYRGGAIELDGVDETENVDFTLENATFTGNEAKIGGAILVNEAKLTYKGGLIYGNRAVITPGSSLPKTSYGFFPYNWNADCFHSGQFSGFGGGIAISKDGQFIIENSHPFGIYGNSADIAGNDISTICSDKDQYKGWSNMNFKNYDYKYFPKTLSIPQPENLNLSGFKIPLPKSAVKWMEDYNSLDSAYHLGTKLQDVEVTKHKRYGELLNDAEGIKKLSGLIVDDTKMKSTKYLHLTLGYNFIFVKLVKEGLKAGDTSIFNISYKDGSNYVKYMTVSLTNTSATDGAVTSRIIALSAGNWKIEETDWAWDYDRKTAAQEFTLDVNPDATKMREIKFINEPKTKPAPNGEGYKINDGMKK